MENNLTKENYFSPEMEKIYMGSSSFKAWDMENECIEAFGNIIEGGCEAREIALRKGEWEKEDKEAFKFGHYVHSWSEGPEAFQEYINDNYSDIYKKNGSPYAPYVVADAVIEVLKNSPIVSKIRDTKEKEVILTGIIGGQKFKIAVDIPNFEKGYWADLKTADKIKKIFYKGGKRMSFIGAFGYKYQFAIYSEIIRQNLGNPEGNYLDPYIIVADKQKLPDHEVIFMGTDYIPEILEEIKRKLPHMIAVRNGEIEPQRCGKCAYCRTTKVLEKPISLAEFNERMGL